jgi:hypothetical protein
MAHPDLRVDYERAEKLARALAEARVDPNEAQKALAYLRSERRGAALFDYLDLIGTKGTGAVVRSNQTLGYYQDLSALCDKHLGPLKPDYGLLVQTYALALRLLRYYIATPRTQQVWLEHFPPAPVVQPDAPPDTTQAIPIPDSSAQAKIEAPRSFETRPLGEVLQAARAGTSGIIQDANGRSFGYDEADVIGTPPPEQSVVRFRPDKKRVPVGKDKKLRPWAFDVEVVTG